MLGIIIGHSEMIIDTIEPTNPIYDNIVEIQKAADRSAKLTRQLLAFARKQTIEPKNIDLNSEISGMLGMLKRLIGESIVLRWSPCDTPCMVTSDPSQVGQILTNLCINARDAIGDRGVIRIRTQKTPIDAVTDQSHLTESPGNSIRLTVSDDGMGMDSETLKKIFEPFFTTKKVGEGTGLGLSTIYGIVKQNQGSINAESIPGAGTTFSIYLPEVILPDKSINPAHVADETAPGKETILLVEDDEAVLEMTKLMLERMGYSVFSSNLPKTALELAADVGDKIDLIISDVIMPEMNGKELIENLRNICPNAAYLYVSGYTADILSPTGIVDEDMQFIQKSYSRHGLQQKVRQILSTRKN
ncbi:MAG: response regulator [Deltaproteobacteria bacterium]|nr:response regulator [Deltaproteobacteria bacterium]